MQVFLNLGREFKFDAGGSRVHWGPWAEEFLGQSDLIEDDIRFWSSNLERGARPGNHKKPWQGASGPLMGNGKWRAFLPSFYVNVLSWRGRQGPLMEEKIGTLPGDKPTKALIQLDRDQLPSLVKWRWISCFLRNSEFTPSVYLQVKF